MYNAITPNIVGTRHKHIWKMENSSQSQNLCVANGKQCNYHKRIFLLEDDGLLTLSAPSVITINQSLICSLSVLCPRLFGGSLLFALAQSKQCNSIIAAGLEWVKVRIPDGKKNVHTFGVAAICWAIWNS
jgi:hypothetical protein